MSGMYGHSNQCTISSRPMLSLLGLLLTVAVHIITVAASSIHASTAHQGITVPRLLEYLTTRQPFSHNRRECIHSASFTCPCAPSHRTLPYHLSSHSSLPIPSLSRRQGLLVRIAVVHGCSCLPGTPLFSLFSTPSLDILAFAYE